MSLQVVWLKRDLRIRDHAPLCEAAARGPCLVLYVYEPEVFQAPEFDPSHLVFINECLAELDHRLRERAGRVTFRVGRMPDVLEELHRAHRIADLWSHEETGTAVTYARDRRVAAWAQERGVRWHEIPQNGVIRRLRSRDGWSRRWLERMNRPVVAPPEALRPVAGVDPGRPQSPADLCLPPSEKREAQRGGESVAHEVLYSFLHERGVSYRDALSSPVTAAEGCSRLSSYLAWGAISLRQVHQATEARRAALRQARAAGRAVDARWARSLSAFSGRLRWHCHFIQKLEDEPRIEFENMSRAYDGLRENEFDPNRFAAWCTGQTGYPLVDACMRCLHRTGWINFRMRAMLASFAAYHLWLHWRPTAVFLARHFLDFEPGIHFAQFQMQSGVTGINTVRIYSPIKQVRDQDPRGAFIRRYVPELRDVPDEYVAEPHKMPLAVQHACGCGIGRDYPPPIVDHAAAYQEARRRMYAIRRTADARTEAQRVYRKHGSRQRPGR